MKIRKCVNKDQNKSLLLMFAVLIQYSQINAHIYIYNLVTGSGALGAIGLAP